MKKQLKREMKKRGRRSEYEEKEKRNRSKWLLKDKQTHCLLRKKRRRGNTN